MGCGLKTVLRKNMSYCTMIAYVLRVVMLCCRKYLTGGHVLVESMSLGWHILQYVVFH